MTKIVHKKYVTTRLRVDALSNVDDDGFVSIKEINPNYVDSLENDIEQLQADIERNSKAYNESLNYKEEIILEHQARIDELNKGLKHWTNKCRYLEEELAKLREGNNND